MGLAGRLLGWLHCYLGAMGGPSLPPRYEAIPLSFLVEKVGGASSDGEQSVLDIPVRNTDHRTQAAMGSQEEVRRFDSMVGPSPVQGWLAASERAKL